MDAMMQSSMTDEKIKSLEANLNQMHSQLSRVATESEDKHKVIEDMLKDLPDADALEQLRTKIISDVNQ
jgi:septal ring factor EnvC (AmiA/AmiB activator)